MTSIRRTPKDPCPQPVSEPQGIVDLTGFDTEQIGCQFRPTYGLWDFDGLYALYVCISESIVSTLSLCGDATLYLIAVKEKGRGCYCYRGYFPDPESQRRFFRDSATLRIPFSKVLLHPLSEIHGNRATGSLELNGTLILPPGIVTTDS